MKRIAYLAAAGALVATTGLGAWAADAATAGTAAAHVRIADRHSADDAAGHHRHGGDDPAGHHRHGADDRAGRDRQGAEPGDDPGGHGTEPGDDNGGRHGRHHHRHGNDG
jgi:hypothetical protein